jgi:NitT/TauT family transport system ATP-binding protein
MNEKRKIADVAQVGDHRVGAPQMSRATDTCCIGFIPLADAAALIVAADHGFAASEGLELDWCARCPGRTCATSSTSACSTPAHLLAPLAIASSLGIGHVRAPLTVPFSLALNGNAITVSPALWAALSTAVEGDLASPAVSARALASLVAARKARRLPPLTWA